MSIALNQPYFMLRRKFGILKEFRVMDPGGQLVCLAHQKAFKLKEDIRIYFDEGKTQEFLVLRARQIMDFNACFDVFDSTQGVKVGAFRRKGFSSLIQDEWQVLDINDQQIATLKEDSLLMALIRRFLSNLIPQNFDILGGDGSKLVDLKQEFNPFFYGLKIDFSVDPQGRLDRRMGIAAGILIAAIEGRQG